MDLSLSPTILILSFLSLYLCYRFLSSSKKSPTHAGFRNYPLLGTLPVFVWNRHRFLDWTTEILTNCPTNTAVFRRPGKIHGVITANPLNVEHMLKTNFDNFPKGERFISLLEDLLGNGIFNSDGEIWRVQRKTASYEFNTKSLRNFVMENVTVELRTRLLPFLEKASESDRVVDLQDVLERFAFDNICKLAFDFDPGCLGGDGTAGAEFMRAFADAATLSSGRFMYVLPGFWKVKKIFNLGSERTLKQSIATVHKFADDIIRSRMEEKTQKHDQDLLSRFMGNEENSSEFLRDIIISFILAGRDTTSSVLTWFFWILSSRPDVHQKILTELEEIRSRSGKQIGDMYSFDELREMHYLQAALSETLRLYPPVPLDTKACRKEDILPDGTFIGKNWFITYHTYAMGRMESIWGKNCTEFWPERWIENGVCRQENPFRFPVFHAGPRMCLGKEMAYIQMKFIAAAVMEKYEIGMQEKNEIPKYLLSLTLRMENGLPVMVKKREKLVSS